MKLIHLALVLAASAPLCSSYAQGSNDCSAIALPDVINTLGNFPVSTIGATTGATPPVACSGFMTNDVWFEWTSPLTGTITVATCGNTTADSIIGVWTGAGCPVGTTTACSDDDCGVTLQSSASFAATSGSVYMIQVGMYNNNLGVLMSMDISTPPPIPANDDCTTPAALSGPGVYSVSNASATTGTQGQTESLCSFFGFTTIVNDVWFTYTPATDGLVTLTTCGVPIASVNDDSKIAVYSGAGCPTPLSAIACNDDNCPASPSFGFETTVSFQAICGVTYLIQFGMYGGSGPSDFYTGDLAITETGGLPCATPSTAFCTGSTIGTTCVLCGNNGAVGSGCANSGFATGALLSTTGIASVTLANDTLSLACTAMTGPGLFFQSTGIIAPITFGDGMLCAAVGILRLGVVFPTAGAGTYGFTGVPSNKISAVAAGLGFPITSGSTRHYQCWYRDTVPLFCPSAVFNTSNGVSLVWGP